MAVAGNIHPDPALTVLVANDHMSVDIIVHLGKDGNLPDISRADIDAALAKEKVTFGIDEKAIAQILGSPPHDTRIRVAEGIAPGHGEPAVIEYQVKTEVHAHPVEREDGSVDYKNMGIIQNVRQGDLLAIKTPATEGTPGTNVHGGTLAQKHGRDVPLPVGKNTVPSEDKLRLFAAIDGQADVINHKIHILNTYTVKGDVSHATGNIDFLGNVEVTGNVLTGFAVQATGNITVNGSVEGAQLTAAGNILICGGVNGFGKGTIKAGGYVKCKYVQSVEIQAAGDIETNFILHSNVQSGSIVRLLGTKAMIAGGRVSALKRIEAVFVGGRGTLVNTILEVGNDPVTLERYRVLPGEISKCEKDIASFERAISLFREYEQRNILTEEKKVALKKASDAWALLAEHLKNLQKENEAVQENMASFGYGVISIRETAFPGVRIFIGSERMNLESKYTHCTFIRDQEGIQMVPYR